MPTTTKRPTIVPTDGDVARELMELTGRIRRSVRRRIRREWHHAPLTDSERELLRLVRERPGLRVQDAAASLGLAGNTVSTLVTRLAREQLLSRAQDPGDARAVRLHLTTAAKRRFAEYRDRRATIAGAALRGLMPSERDAIAVALPALRRLVELVEAG